MTKLVPANGLKTTQLDHLVDPVTGLVDLDLATQSVPPPRPPSREELAHAYRLVLADLARRQDEAHGRLRAAECAVDNAPPRLKARARQEEQKKRVRHWWIARVASWISTFMVELAATDERQATRDNGRGQ